MERNDDNDPHSDPDNDPGPPRRVDRGDPDLVAVMAKLAQGDEAAVVTLFDRYGGPISAAVRRQVAFRGRHRIDQSDLEGLVWEVCDEIGKVAHAWRPDGGALPWVWARHRVANVVDRVLGPATEPLDEARLAGLAELGGLADRATLADQPVEGVEAAAGGSMLDALERLVPDLGRASLLAEALDAAKISERDRELWFEYQYEKHSGNASPAATVAPVFGMREASVRQAARRARQRILRLIDDNERFAPLADLPLLA